MSREQAEGVLRRAAEKPRELLQVLHQLPPGTDPELAADGVLTLFADRSTWAVARKCQKLPPAAARRVVERLEGQARPEALFVRALVDVAGDDRAVAEGWQAALQALLDLDTTYPWGSQKRREKLASLARRPRVVAAIQAAAVSHRRVRLDWLAVLAADGSEASLDALIPQVHAAVDDPGGALRALDRLRTHAKDTPTVKALLGKVERELSQRHAQSGALGLAAAIGLSVQKELWFDLWLGSRQLNVHGVPRLQLDVAVDSGLGEWLRLSLSELPDDYAALPRARRTAFTNLSVRSDALGLGPCEPAALPQWLSATASTLGVEWAWERARPRTHLRGKNRARLTAWLRGG